MPPFGKLPAGAALSRPTKPGAERYCRPDKAQPPSGKKRAQIFQIADSKKAPLGRFFTLVGRAGFEPATN